MKTNYIDTHNYLEQRLAQLGREIPGPMTGFARLHRKAMDDGALRSAEKQMMALAISIVVGCDGCIAYHVHDAVEAGATRAGTNGDGRRRYSHGRRAWLHLRCARPGRD